MAIETSWENRILIVQAEERLDSVNAQVFMDRLGSAVDGAAQGVVIDMKRLVYISHAGLQVVRSMEREDARLALCALNPMFSAHSRPAAWLPWSTFTPRVRMPSRPLRVEDGQRRLSLTFVVPPPEGPDPSPKAQSGRDGMSSPHQA